MRDYEEEYRIIEELLLEEEYEKEMEENAYLIIMADFFENFQLWVGPYITEK